jgi:hypothetical protein
MPTTLPASTRFAQLRKSYSVQEGSIITSINQSGGITAHSVTVVGRQPRSFSAAAVDAVTTALRRYPLEPCDLFGVLNDPDASGIAHSISQGILNAGCNIESFSPMYVPASRIVGVVIDTPAISNGLEALIAELQKAGLEVTVNIDASKPRPRIIVGTA